MSRDPNQHGASDEDDLLNEFLDAKDSQSTPTDKTISEQTLVEKTILDKRAVEKSRKKKSVDNPNSTTLEDSDRGESKSQKTLVDDATLAELDDLSFLTEMSVDPDSASPTPNKTVDTTLPERSAKTSDGRTDNKAEDLSFLTEMSAASAEVPSADSNDSASSDTADDDLSHLTEMTFEAGTTKLTDDSRDSIADDSSLLTEMTADATEVTSDLPNALSINKTAKATKTQRHYDATMGETPGVEVNEADEFRFRQSSKKSDLPKNVGRYEVKRLLGEGTFGKVYEARDPQLDRIVAVKVAKAISGRTQIRRFLREARAAASLRHPNIIPVYEYGQVDGENIIVYEFVAGETLKAYIRRLKTPPLEDTIRIVREIAEGLHYAHEQGIIHRDIKPENVLVDPNGRPHIADFGCARSIDDKTNLTIDGSILGTPMYMSPEQAGGKANIADGRTDIWSLGVMLYEMVAGDRPFRGQLSDLLFAICNKDPAPIRKINPAAHPDIETICSKCLTRELDDRFATAGILSDELGRFQRGEPIESRRISTLKRTWMWAKRNQAVAGLMAAVAVTLLVGSIVSSAFAYNAHVERKERAIAQMNALTNAESSALPGIFKDLLPFQASILPQLKEKLASTQNTPKAKHRLRMAIIELEDDASVREKLADSMVDDLLKADPGDFFVCRKCLRFRKDELSETLWIAATDLSKKSSEGRRFRAAAALALYDPTSPRWNEIAPNVTGYLTSINEIEMSYWLKSILPVRDWLKPTLVGAFLSRDTHSDTMPQRAAAILSMMFIDDVPFLVELVPSAATSQIPYLSGAFEVNHSDAVKKLQAKMQSLPEQVDSLDSDAIQKSNLITILIQLGEDEPWKQLDGGSDMTVATELTERLGPTSTSFERLESQVQKWDLLDSDVLAGILLSLGQFEVLDAQKNKLQPTLLAAFEKHPDSRVHSSARWILSQWKFQDDVARVELKLRSQEPDAKLNWHVDMAGNTFALFGPIDAAEIGIGKSTREYWSDDSRVANMGFDAGAILHEPSHKKQIPRRFGICIHEVTVGEFVPFQESVLANYNLRIEKVGAEIKALENSIAEAKQTAVNADSKETSNDEGDSNSDATKTAKEEKDDPQQQELIELLRTKKRLEIRKKEPERMLKRMAELDPQIPISKVDYFTSLGFCRWTSEQMGTECGLPSVEKLQEIYEFQTDFLLTQEHLAKQGYRLPTAAEWEYACRGGTETLFPFGQSPSGASNYAWFVANSDNRLQRIGQLKPGNTGLFDVIGNVDEWCLDWYRKDLPKLKNGKAPDVYIDFGPQFQEKFQSLQREFRGGSFEDEVFDLRSSARFSTRPSEGFTKLGFRLARTYAMPPPKNLKEVSKVENE